MKKRLLLLPIGAVMAYFSLTSNRTGFISSNQCGSSGGTPSCSVGSSGCHSTSANTSIVDSIALDSAGTLVTKYTAGKHYTIRFGGVQGIVTATLPKFGFQLSVVKASTSTHLNAGTFVAPLPTNTDTTSFSIPNSPCVMYQTAALAPVSGTGGIGTVYLVSIPWDAPATAGTGDITIYGILNAVNNDSMASTSDMWNFKNRTVQERVAGGGGASVATFNEGIHFSTFPNPVLNSMNIAFSNAETGEYAVNVYDLNGRVVARKVIDVSGDTNATINMSNLAGGIYQVIVSKDGFSKTVSVAKQ